VQALVAVSGAKAGGVQRSSDLAAPTMLLSGHGAEVTSCRFAPDGRLLASSSFDKLICEGARARACVLILRRALHSLLTRRARAVLWEASGACRNVRALKGHRAAVLEAQWNWESKLVLSASADATAAVFDAEDGAKVRGFKGHEE
jgi:Prp8 binding protein